MQNQKTISNFISRYKKRLIAIIGIAMIPSTLVLFAFIGTGVYLFVNNDNNFHPYKSYIVSGYNQGQIDGERDKRITGFNSPQASQWEHYEAETRRIKKSAILAKDNYLSQFPMNERGIKRAEMKSENIKLPIEEKLSKRYKSGVAFYAALVKERIKRENYESDQEFKEAQKEEAWKLGYEHGYSQGWMFWASWARTF